MPDIIQLLPDSIANQIAAGEVVQRPASAVKELLENAVDAGATQVKLIIKDAGKVLIQVIDNGAGMSETDARMSLERHATSKIRKTEDLFTLRTMGFRGEALASIAAVSQMELKTRPAEREIGTLIFVEGSEVRRQEPVATEVGTSISVRNLFYNIPARRNFLKSNPVEVRHINEEFQRVVLAHPQIGFSFYINDDAEYDLLPGKLSQRIVSVFGKSYQQQLAPCQEETDLVKLHGYVGRPEAARKTRGEQFIFVNNRFIRSNYLNHAVMSAFEGLIGEGSFPFYVLFIEIDPRHIDVNIHPTKTEIKFDDDRSIYGVVLAAVRQALGTHNLSPAIDFNEDVNIVTKLERATSDQTREIYFDERFQHHLHRTNLEHWETLLEAGKGSRLTQDQARQPVRELKFESAVNLPETSGPVPDRWLVQLEGRYILRQVRSGLMFVDQQAAHERILFEKNLQRLVLKTGESQQSLFPQTVELAPADFALALEMAPEIRALGFRFEVFGRNSFVVEGIPAHVTPGREKALFEGLVEQFKDNQATLSLPIRENLALALARRAGIRHGQMLQKEEMSTIVDQLMACKTPNFTPDGKPTFFIFEFGKIETYFNRQSAQRP
ncbi:MAG TPA: DNA mismatch repair endonuclease MutL [Cyclobacteriaceae bacterium]|nr:DNA mismatch repair endonuclease MutL [Cyclobacteriaceae bacterium]